MEIKKIRRLELIAELHRVANSVTSEDNGDRQALLGSGFELFKQREPSVLVPPTGYTLTDGSNIGQMRFCLTGGRGIKNLLFQIAPDPVNENSLWSSEPGTTRDITFHNLTSKTRYWTRAIVTGSKSQTFITNPISRVAQ